jgi:tetratricopeptide (TPR) repeat protein
MAAIIAHDALLYDAEGEFLADAFEPEGEELTPTFALRQAERALRKDPDSAIYHHERGVALRRAGKLDSARESFGAAAAIDPTNPWPWFDLGRADQALGRYAEAAAAFECAAEAADGAEGARFCAWAARAFHLAGERTTADRLRAAALARNPGLLESLRAAAAAAIEDEDPDGARDAEELAALLGGVPLSRRLPVLTSTPAAAAPARPAKPAVERKATAPVQAQLKARPGAKAHKPAPKPGRPGAKAAASKLGSKASPRPPRGPKPKAKPGSGPRR